MYLFKSQSIIDDSCMFYPKYAYILKVDEKSDVYSFDVVLLELVIGRRHFEKFGDGVDIVQWVRNMI